MDLRTRTNKIRQKLREAYPTVKTQLHHRNPFELLVATILSAQCTDKQVNAVTGRLFERLPDPQAFSKAPLSVIEELIHSIGFFRNKARNLKKCARTLLEVHDGNVPDTMEALVKLPGVGRKTANVVLGAAFGVPGVVVDTHVARISGRLGLTCEKNPVRIEQDLMGILPPEDWSDFTLRLVYFGREICRARQPWCGVCILASLCPWTEKTKAGAPPHSGWSSPSPLMGEGRGEG